MNLTTRSQAKLRSRGSDPKPASPNSQKSDSPKPANATRKKASEAAETKAKRVRTGCLTCRERHLKCDEALGRCLNCRKSDRICRRGVRLNFIDIQTVAPPHIIARPRGANVTFRDDSRFIASEYVGGYERYPPVQPDSPIEERRHLHQEAFNLMGHDQLASLFQSVAHSFDPTSLEFSHAAADYLLGPDAWHEPHLVPGDELLPHGTSNFARRLAVKQQNPASISDPEQVQLLQVFIDEVGLWIDSMDSMSHFTQVLPFHAIDEPMLLKAFLACGARHIFLVNSAYGEDKAFHFYELATQDLMNALQDINRDSVLCATAAMILAMYELMSPQLTSKPKHIPGSRALIHECNWTAKTPGLGGACFWLSISMELLSCLQHGWSMSWDPDSWGLDMDMEQVQSFGKVEDLWLHRMIYICAKVANSQAAMHQLHLSNDANARVTRLNEALQEWNHYSTLCDQWDKLAPRSIKPLGYLEPWQTDSSSLFPKVWLIKRPAIIAQLFYHTARILLTRTHPMKLDLHDAQQNHAYGICGIVANVKDRSIIPVSIRCLEVAAECLETREAQEEALGLMNTISKGTAWHTESTSEKLRHNWGWPALNPETVDPARMHNGLFGLDPALPLPNSGDPPGITNPLFSAADFSLETHPYQGSYVAPHHTLDHYHIAPYLL